MLLNEELFENKILTEKFSDTMPKWLQSRLLYTKPGVNSEKKDDYQKRGFDIDSQSKPRYAARGSRRSIFDLFRVHNIDLDNANFIEGDVPTSSKDPRLKEPNIPIFLLKGTEPYTGEPISQVYAKGINDDELYRLGEDDKKLQYVSLKTLLQNCEAFCYLDSSDSSNFTSKDRKAERRARNAEEENSPFKRFTPEEQTRWRGSDIRYDKSGYLIDPSKLKNRLSEYKATNSAKVIEKLYRRISNIKNDFAQIYLNSDINDLKSDVDFKDIFGDTYNGLNRRLLNIVEEYNDFVNGINRILDDPNRSEEKKKEEVINYFKYYYSGIDTDIKNLEKRAERVLSVDLDWD